jgi:hypothetical protein
MFPSVGTFAGNEIFVSTYGVKRYLGEGNESVDDTDMYTESKCVYTISYNMPSPKYIATTRKDYITSYWKSHINTERIVKL